MRRVLLFILPILLLASCDLKKIPDSSVPKEANEYAVNYLNRIFAGDTTYCLNPQIYKDLNDSGRQFIINVCGKLQGKRIISSRVIGVQKSIGLAGATKNYSKLDYEYAIDNGYLYFSFKLEKNKDNNMMLIDGFNASYTLTSLSQQNEFKFAGKSFWQYFLLLAAIYILIFEIVTLVVAIRSKIPKKGWWIVFILLGITQFSVNWTTGAINFSLLHITVLGVSIMKYELVGPWMISVSIPLGAFLFWRKKARLKKQKERDDEFAALYVQQEEIHKELPNEDEVQ